MHVLLFEKVVAPIEINANISAVFYFFALKKVHFL